MPGRIYLSKTEVRHLHARVRRCDLGRSPARADGRGSGLTTLMGNDPGASVLAAEVSDVVGDEKARPLVPAMGGRRPR